MVVGLVQGQQGLTVVAVATGTLITERGANMKDTRQLFRAEVIQRTLGTFIAARYLRKRGWSIEAALWVLAHR